MPRKLERAEIIATKERHQAWTASLHTGGFMCRLIDREDDVADLKGRHPCFFDVMRHGALVFETRDVSLVWFRRRLVIV
ncbi:hypothetical protein CWO90_10715 [Bradyrhizobium sp. Leo121]|nr:hypothetical protein CWO90_10715 [Bradyrhizobium sp. Leo121]